MIFVRQKPSIDVGEFMRRMPHVWDDGALLLGHEKTSVFFVDAKSGGMICSHESDNSASTLVVRLRASVR